MTQKEKQLLLKDLCGRLPYKVIIHYHWSRNNTLIDIIDEDKELDLGDIESLKYIIEDKQSEDWCEISWKPYLRLMSSMTQEEYNEYENYVLNEKDELIKFCNSMNFYNRNHFDYRGLIPMGLALEAPEDMYKID